MIDMVEFAGKLEFLKYCLWGFAEISRGGTCIDERALDGAAYYVSDMGKEFEKIMEEMDKRGQPAVTANPNDPPED